MNNLPELQQIKSNDKDSYVYIFPMKNRITKAEKELLYEQIISLFDLPLPSIQFTIDEIITNLLRVYNRKITKKSLKYHLNYFLKANLIKEIKKNTYLRRHFPISI